MTGRPELTASRTMITVLTASLAVLVVVAGVVVLARGGGSGSEPQAVEAAPSAAGTSVASPRMSWIVPRPSGPEGAGVLEVTGPECDSAVINADLLFPNSGARIIDCQAGWAVMASAVSGDPSWVKFSDGRWRRVEGVSSRLGTCPDEAIAEGAPAWMAQKHLGRCSTRGRTAPPAPRPAPAPTPERTSAATISAPPPASLTRTSTRPRAPVEDTAPPATSSRQTSVTTSTSPPTSVTTPTSPPTSDTTPSTAADDAPGPDGE